MRILVANLGSTSFKFKLLDEQGVVLSSGGYERIGQSGSPFRNHGDVIDVILKELPQPPDAIGFKAVHGGPISGAVPVTEQVIETMRQFADVAPAHNPPYIAAMEAFKARLPGIPQVACFETAFHQTIPLSRQIYGIPWQWTEELGIRRYGFHGASHRYIATRVAEIAGERARRVISCHLGGSCSVCAIEDGKSVANSLGMTPQTGVFHNNRCGEFDIFAMPRLLGHGFSLEDTLKKLSREGGLLGISGVSNDMRDLEKAAAEGNRRACLAIEAFVESIRHYIGAYAVVLGGIDVLAFTGGIGEKSPAIREAVCRNLEFLGLQLDERANQSRGQEKKISRDNSPGQIWVIPANEELILARQVAEVVGKRKKGQS